MIKKVKVVIVVLFFIVTLVPLMNCSGSGASVKKIDNAPREIKNLEAFTRLYGYVRFFYPGDEAAALDWDRFAVYGAAKVETAKTDEELKKKLEELFLPIAPALLIHDVKEKRAFSLKSITPPDMTGMKPVSWQHYGVQLTKEFDVFDLYKSIRLNRKPKKGPLKFGNLMQYIGAESYRGKEIRLRAAMKVKSGFGRLWLRMDRSGGAPIFDNMDDRPVPVSDWSYVEIKTEIPEDMVFLSLGCLLHDDGELLVDDFSMEVRDKGASKWEAIALKNSGFERDSTGEHHPTGWFVDDGSYSYSVTEESAAQGRKSFAMKSHHPGLFQTEAQMGDHVAKDLGSGLAVLMPLVLYGTEKSTFPGSPVTELNTLIEALKTDVPEKMTADNKAVRLGAVVKAWNVFQHFFPYFDVAKSDWKAELRKALGSALRDKTPGEFKKTLQRLTAALKDGHIWVAMAGEDDRWHPPIDWKIIEDHLVVTAVFDETLDSVKPGDVVQQLNGVPVTLAMAAQRELCSAATVGWMKYRVENFLLRGTEGEALALKLERDGERFDVTLKRSLKYGIFRKHRAEKRRKSGKIEAGIHYLDLDQLTMAEITEMMPQLQKANAIIFDMRGYPRNNLDLLRHLLKKGSHDRGWGWVPQIVYPDYRDVTFNKIGWNLTAVEPHLEAKIIFITEGRAISAAESFLSFIEGYDLGVIVGQPTAGSNGNVNPFTVPGGFRISWTGMKVVKHDGSQHHGVGIIPDVPVTTTIKAIEEGRDEFFEKALEIAKGNE